MGESKECESQQISTQTNMPNCHSLKNKNNAIASYLRIISVQYLPTKKKIVYNIFIIKKKKIYRLRHIWSNQHGGMSDKYPHRLNMILEIQCLYMEKYINPLLQIISLMWRKYTNNNLERERERFVCFSQ